MWKQTFDYYKKMKYKKQPKFFHKAFNSVGEKWTLDTAIKRIKQYYNPDSCWVAVIDSKIVGVLTSKIDNVVDHQELYIDIIAVDPELHQKGTGKKLLETAEIYSKSNGLEYIWLTANPKLFSYDWYIKSGFTESSWKAITKKLG